jgi:hypothetical protein
MVGVQGPAVRRTVSPTRTTEFSVPPLRGNSVSATGRSGIGGAGQFNGPGGGNLGPPAKGDRRGVTTDF